METPELFDRLTVIFQDVFDDDEIVARPELTASDVEDWDSLKHIRLILSIEKAFHVSFSAAEVGNLKNVGELAKLIQSKL